MAARNPFRDFNILELDPVQEVVRHVVRRKKERRLPEYLVSQVTFFQSLFVFIDCLLPACRGHQKFGVVESENVPVIFKSHDYNDQAKYVAYKTPISRPLRVPLDGDVLLNGIKWELAAAASSISVTQGFFDCLLANLKFLTLTKEFCIECLFRHTNGLGLSLERLIKTTLYHILAYGRFLDRDHFQPITKYQKGMDLKFRRVHWERRDKMFKHSCHPTKEGSKEGFFFSIPDVIVPEYPFSPKHGLYCNPDLMFLHNLNSISVVHASTQCQCNSGKPVPRLVHIGLIRQIRKCDFYSVALAKWDQDGDQYSDPLLNWSVLGPEGPNKSILKNLAQPLTSVCKVCRIPTLVKDVYIPPSTWLIMADIPINLQKCSVDHLSNVGSFVMSGVLFDLKFVLLYNTLTGSMTSMNLVGDGWFYMDDQAGGIFKRCSPERVNYKNRVNLRAIYFRRIDQKPHLCLQDAVSRS